MQSTRVYFLRFSAIFAALAAGCSASQGSSGESVDATSSALTTSPAPLGAWHFDDCAAGSTALRDSSGNAFGATASGGVTCTASGHSGAAAVLDGATGAITVADTPALDAGLTTAVTVAAWVKPSVVPTSSNHSYAIVTKWDNHADTLKLQLTSAGYKFTIAVPNGSGGEKPNAGQAPASLSTTARTHIARVYDRRKKTPTLHLHRAGGAHRTASGLLRASSAPQRIRQSPPS